MVHWQPTGAANKRRKRKSPKLGITDLMFNLVNCMNIENVESFHFFVLREILILGLFACLLALKYRVLSRFRFKRNFGSGSLCVSACFLIRAIFLLCGFPHEIKSILWYDK